MCDRTAARVICAPAPVAVAKRAAALQTRSEGDLPNPPSFLRRSAAPPQPRQRLRAADERQQGFQFRAILEPGQS